MGMLNQTGMRPPSSTVTLQFVEARTSRLSFAPEMPLQGSLEKE